MADTITNPTNPDYSSDPTLPAKEAYTLWCKEQQDIPVFMQPWWLDAVCAGKQWDVFLFRNPRTGGILAAMPYLLCKRLGMSYILMPQMTQIGGIWFDHTLRNEDGSIWDKALEKEVCTTFAARLEELKLNYYYQHFPIGSACPELMKGLGFKIKQRVTYRLDDLSDLDKVIDRFSRNKKRQLQKALSLHAEFGMSAEQFYRWHEHCLMEKGKKISYTREFLLVLERKTSRNRQSEIVRICNADGEVYAAAFVVWNSKVMHYLIAAQDDKHNDSGAMALLVLECIKLARKKGLIFDFEGSMIRGVAQHFKQFGSTPTNYYSVEKYYRWWFRFAVWLNFLVTWKKR
jgi:hypothetical protein